jgi:hypothetical protein
MPHVINLIKNWRKLKDFNGRGSSPGPNYMDGAIVLCFPTSCRRLKAFVFVNEKEDFLSGSVLLM